MWIATSIVRNINIQMNISLESKQAVHKKKKKNDKYNWTLRTHQTVFLVRVNTIPQDSRLLVLHVRVSANVRLGAELRF